MTIATSSDIENVDFYFEHMHLGRWFELDKVAYNDGTFRRKPHPDVFQVAARKLNLEPQETVMFEDSVAGILYAEAVGAGKIYIVNSFCVNLKSIGIIAGRIVLFLCRLFYCI